MDVPDPVLNPGDLLIRPIWKLAYYLDFDGFTLRNQVALGQLDALKYLDQFLRRLYGIGFRKSSVNVIVPIQRDEIERRKIRCAGQQDVDGIVEEIYQFILGYVPRKLENKYTHEFIFGRILECMGLVAGISPYRQMHFNDIHTAHYLMRASVATAGHTCINTFTRTAQS